jgi:hypothetical protein
MKSVRALTRSLTPFWRRVVYYMHLAPSSSLLAHSPLFNMELSLGNFSVPLTKDVGRWRGSTVATAKDALPGSSTAAPMAQVFITRRRFLWQRRGHKIMRVLCVASCN